MALLNILQYPDPRLKNKAIPVAIDKLQSQVIQTIIDDMFETMYQAHGIGLAATQVNISLQIITMDLSETQNTPICLINPQIVNQPQDITLSTEGCLSFPGIYVNIKRYKTIDIKFLDRQAQEHNLHVNDLLSICIQHELDHLNGITFFDHLSSLKKNLLEKKLKKLRKHNL